MLKSQRQRELINLLEMSEIMSIADLSVKLNSSMMTIRRDLEYLEEKGIVKKLHGGALLVKNDTQPSFHERIEELNDEKAKIGKKAAALIENNSIVFFDAGTTPLAVIEFIPDNIEFTAITTGLMTAIALCSHSNINVINIGGNIHKTSYSSVNYLSVDLIKKFNADIAFISAKAISLPQGTYEPHLPLIEIKRAVVEVSKKTVLLADHSKFENRSLCLSVPFDNIDLIITDDITPTKIIDEIKGLGKDVIIAQ